MTEGEYLQLKKVFPFDFPEDLDQEFPLLWKERTFDRNELITESGQVEKYFYFVLEALTPSRMLYLPLEAYLSLFERYPQFDRWGRLFFQGLLIGRVNREVELLTLPAQERYIDFMRRCPEELLQIPQKYLASYLNMTPETFSRLRARVKY